MFALTVERVRSLLHYNPISGVLTWRVNRRRARAGNRAGHLDVTTGYRVVTVDYEDYLEHRLIWFYMTGQWPSRDLDHRNTHKADNRWLNLRLATDSQNGCNRRALASNTTGFKGVVPHRGKFRAQGTFQGKTWYLPVVETAAEAAAAYAAKVQQLHGAFARVA